MKKKKGKKGGFARDHRPGNPNGKGRAGGKGFCKPKPGEERTAGEGRREQKTLPEGVTIGLDDGEGADEIEEQLSRKGKKKKKEIIGKRHDS